eukprot:4447222-Ditylum_brightwellii.AAC.1
MLPPSEWKVWQEFKKLCNSGGRKNTLIKTTKSKLDALMLDGEWARATDVECMDKFVKNIADTDFETFQYLFENFLDWKVYK